MFLYSPKLNAPPGGLRTRTHPNVLKPTLSQNFPVESIQTLIVCTSFSEFVFAVVLGEYKDFLAAKNEDRVFISDWLFF